MRDAQTGKDIIGAEDLAVDQNRQRLIISAYDRRASEKAARQRGPAGPNGGIYAAPLATLFALDRPAEPLALTALTSPDDFDGGLRPHGLSFNQQADVISFVNRSYIPKKSGRWKLSPMVKSIGAQGEPILMKDTPTPCAANDVLIDGSSLYSSFDHSACNWRAGLEDVFRLKRSGIAGSSGEALLSGVAFANGLALTPAGNILLAATRESAVLSLRKTQSALTEEMRFAMPGAPDNITINHQGAAIIATHPSLFRLALQRKLGIGRAPCLLYTSDAADE